MSGQDIETEFVRAINLWKSTMFTDSPQTRSIYAYAAAYVLKRLQHCCNDADWEAVRQDFVEFSATYIPTRDQAL